MTRKTRDDVIAAAGRLFALSGYEGTSMRELGRELDLLGSSLYSHVGSKQDLLVEVVQRGAALFQTSVERALAVDGPAVVRLRALVAGHVDVLLDHRDEVRTFLNEARSLDSEHRASVLAARDRYEAAFRAVLEEGGKDGSIDIPTEPRLASIFLLSVLNAMDRWYRDSGRLDRAEIVEEVLQFCGVREP